MLILARKINEKILIGDDIEITVVGVTGDTVRLGINAPKDCKILRREVYEELQKQNQEAVAAAPLDDKEVAARLKEMFGVKQNQ